MAHVTTLTDGTVLIDCPECGRTREAACFRGNLNEEHGWFSSCKYCRAKNEFVASIGKPSDAGWDDVAYPCVECSGTGQYHAARDMNGKPMSVGGICFRCKGKGNQTWRDVGRNSSYDGWVAFKAIQGDMARAEATDAREFAEQVVEGLKDVPPSPEEVEFEREFGLQT